MNTLIFLHVPKAAGSTLRPILEGFYDENEVFIVKDDIPADFERLCAMSVSPKLVFGHMCYGWHKALPSGQDYQYATILRNPTERVQSLYYYIRRSRNHFLHDEVKDMSVIEFVESGVHSNSDNGMVRQLCGIDRFYNQHNDREPYNDSNIPYGEITHEHLKLARDNLTQECMVGVLNKFDEYLHNLCHTLGHRVPWFETRNRTPSSQKEPLTCDERIAIVKYNRFDWELYMTAMELA